MKLTIEQIEAAKTPNGGYRLAQLMALGYRPKKPGQWPEKGWKERLTQREITEAQYAEFVRLAGIRPREAKKEMKLSDIPDLFTRP